MAVGEKNLDGVVPYLRGALRPGLWLIHRQHRGGRQGQRFFLAALVVAGRTGTVITQKRKIEVACVAVGPANVDACSGFHVYPDVCWLLSLVDG